MFFKYFRSVKKIILYLLVISLFACTDDEKKFAEIAQSSKDISSSFLVEGTWQVFLELSTENQLPFDFTLSKKDTSYQIEITNAGENIIVTNVHINKNKITIKDPVFNSWFEGEIISPTKIKGFWYKENKEYKIAFKATHGIQKRFKAPIKLNKYQPNITGSWEVDFSKDNIDGHYKAIGQFNQEGDYVSGTFMTEVGDYRFLEGNMYNNKLYLSCFDGAHAFLFKATIGEHDTLRGTFWSGNHWEEPWVAFKNKNFRLANPDSLTHLKKGYKKLAFTFPNLEKKAISLADNKYKNKVVIVNIMGPWCPNCKDETAYLTQLYNNKHENGLEIIALAFDKAKNFEQSKKNVERLKNYFNAKYDFLIAGKADKLASARL